MQWPDGLKPCDQLFDAGSLPEFNVASRRIIGTHLGLRNNLGLAAGQRVRLRHREGGRHFDGKAPVQDGDRTKVYVFSEDDGARSFIDQTFARRRTSMARFSMCAIRAGTDGEAAFATEISTRRPSITVALGEDHSRLITSATSLAVEKLASSRKQR